MNTRIFVNGQTCVAGKDKPVELQRQIDQITRSLAEQNGGQSAGVLEGPDNAAVRVATSHQFVINGRRYASIDEMPPADRKLFEQMRGLLVDQAFGKSPSIVGGSVNPAAAYHENGDSARQLVAYTAAPTFLSSDREGSDLAWLGQLFLLLLGISIGLAIAAALWFALK